MDDVAAMEADRFVYSWACAKVTLVIGGQGGLGRNGNFTGTP
jgi:hypothetical protein